MSPRPNALGVALYAVTILLSVAALAKLSSLVLILLGVHR
jgi:hypothetical protein